MLKRLSLGLAFCVASGVCWAQGSPSLLYSPQPPIGYVGSGFDPSNPVNNENQLIQALNTILTGVFQPNPNGVNYPQLGSGVSGIGVTVGVNPASANANVAVKIVPKGNGSIALFDSTANMESTGVIKVGNQPSWVKAPGFATCPALLPGQGGPLSGSGYQVAQYVTGYLIIKDWLDRPHGVPGC